MSIGARRQFITIKEKLVTSPDSYGQDHFTWVTHATAWADIRSLQGREMDAVKQIWAEAQFKFYIEPFISGIERNMVISWGTRTLNILDCEDPTGQHKALKGYASELVQ